MAADLTSGAILAGLTGVAAIIVPASLCCKPEIVHDVKIVVHVKVEKVDDPQVVEVQQIVEVPRMAESTKVVERPGPVSNQPTPCQSTPMATPITAKPAPSTIVHDITPLVPAERMRKDELMARTDF